MGDRANVKIVEEGSPGYSSTVYLYTHWNGTELPKTVQTALARRERWDDPYYLARIVFCEMVKGQEREATGFGISSVVGDGTERIIMLEDKTVTLNDKTYTFEEYLKLKNPNWPEFGEFSESL